MEIAISQLRAELASWIDRARAGEEVLITERGIPVARLAAVESASLLERLTSEGVLSRAEPGDSPVASRTKRAKATGSVSDLVSEQRR